jgi:hypothetical protein
MSYSLNGRHWFLLGRVENLPPIPGTGYFKYYGECIQNRSAGGKDKMPHNHRKAALIEVMLAMAQSMHQVLISPALQVDNFLGSPAKYIRFSNLANHGVSTIHRAP